MRGAVGGGEGINKERKEEKKGKRGKEEGRDERLREVGGKVKKKSVTGGWAANTPM